MRMHTQQLQKVIRYYYHSSALLLSLLATTSESYNFSQNQHLVGQGPKHNLLSLTPIPRTHPFPLCIQQAVHTWPEPPVNYTFRISLFKKSLKRPQKRQLKVLLPTSPHPIMFPFQNKSIMESAPKKRERERIKLRSYQMATKTRFLPCEQPGKNGILSSTPKQPCTPNHTVNNLGAKLEIISSPDMVRRLNSIDMSEFSHFFSFS